MFTGRNIVISGGLGALGTAFARGLLERERVDAELAAVILACPSSSNTCASGAIISVHGRS